MVTPDIERRSQEKPAEANADASARARLFSRLREKFRQRGESLRESLAEVIDGHQAESGDFTPLELNPSHETNDALANIIRADLGKREGIINAQRQKVIDTLKGEGEGQGEKALLSGRAAGLREIQVALEVDGDAVLASETSRNVLSEHANTVVLGAQGAGDLIGIVAAGKAALGSKKTNSSEPKPAEEV